MSDFRLVIELETPSEARRVMRFGLADFRDHGYDREWRTLVGEFLKGYLATKTVVLRITNAEAYDWYSSYLTDAGVPLQTLPEGRSLVQIYASPSHRQLEDLLDNLLTDEVWEIGGLLSIAVVQGEVDSDLVNRFHSPYALIKPINDGAAIEWSGPAEEAVIVETLARACALESGATVGG